MPDYPQFKSGNGDIGNARVCDRAVGRAGDPAIAGSRENVTAMAPRQTLLLVGKLAVSAGLLWWVVLKVEILAALSSASAVRL